MSHDFKKILSLSFTLNGNVCYKFRSMLNFINCYVQLKVIVRVYTYFFYIRRVQKGIAYKIIIFKMAAKSSF